MSQSFANTNNFPLELDLGRRPLPQWDFPKPGMARFLRYPGPQDGAGYRVARLAVIAALKVRQRWAKRQH